MRACIGAMMYCAVNEQKMKRTRTINEWNDTSSSIVFEWHWFIFCIWIRTWLVWNERSVRRDISPGQLPDLYLCGALPFLLIPLTSFLWVRVPTTGIGSSRAVVCVKHVWAANLPRYLWCGRIPPLQSEENPYPYHPRTDSDGLECWEYSTVAFGSQACIWRSDGRLKGPPSLGAYNNRFANIINPSNQ